MVIMISKLKRIGQIYYLFNKFKALFNDELTPFRLKVKGSSGSICANHKSFCLLTKYELRVSLMTIPERRITFRVFTVLKLTAGRLT